MCLLQESGNPQINHWKASHSFVFNIESLLIPPGFWHGGNFSGRSSYRLSSFTGVCCCWGLMWKCHNMGCDAFRVCCRTKDHFSLFFLHCGEGRKQPLGCFLFVLQRKAIELWFCFLSSAVNRRFLCWRWVNGLHRILFLLFFEMWIRLGHEFWYRGFCMLLNFLIESGGQCSIVDQESFLLLPNTNIARYC